MTNNHGFEKSCDDLINSLMEQEPVSDSDLIAWLDNALCEAIDSNEAPRPLREAPLIADWLASSTAPLSLSEDHDPEFTVEVLSACSQVVKANLSELTPDEWADLLSEAYDLTGEWLGRE